MDLEEKPEFPWAMVAGAAVVILLLGGVWLLTRGSGTTGPAADQRLPMGEAEKAYAARIEFKDIKMSRAENLLNQQITFIFAVLVNNGARTIHDMEVTVEFKDLLNQVVLRERMRPFGPPGTAVEPLPGGRSREFQLNLEHVPVQWNRQYPTFRVTGLLLE